MAVYKVRLKEWLDRDRPGEEYEPYKKEILHQISDLSETDLDKGILKIDTDLIYLSIERVPNSEYYRSVLQWYTGNHVNSNGVKQVRNYGTFQGIKRDLIKNLSNIPYVPSYLQDSLKESFSKFGSPTDLQTFIDQFDPTSQGSKSAYLKTVSAMIKKYKCTRDEAKAVLADWFSWEDPDLLKESLDSDIHELENFMDLHYYGLPDVKLQDVPSEELKKMRDIARRALDSSSRSYGRYSNDEDSYYMRRYRKYLDLLNDTLKIARDKEAGIYDIKRQIEKDLWSIVVPLFGTNWTYRTLDPDKLKELRQKYKDNSSLFNRLVKDVHRSLDSND